MGRSDQSRTESLLLLGEGLSFQQIADELSISRNTVRTHCEMIRNKLGRPLPAVPSPSRVRGTGVGRRGQDFRRADVIPRVRLSTFQASRGNEPCRTSARTWNLVYESNSWSRVEMPKAMRSNRETSIWLRSNSSRDKPRKAGPMTALKSMTVIGKSASTRSGVANRDRNILHAGQYTGAIRLLGIQPVRCV